MRPYCRWIVAPLLCVAAATSPQAVAQGAEGKIAFSRSVFYPGGALRHINLYRINPDGSGFRQLTPTVENHYRFLPAWSPHGTYLAYTLLTQTTTEEDWDIWRVDANGTTRRRVTSGPQDFQYPSWNPAGTLIGFRSTALDGTTCVGVVRPDGTGQRDLICAPPGSALQETAPSWRSDGRMIAVVRRVVDSPTEPPNTFLDVYCITVSTRQATLLHTVEASGAYSLFIAPDGRRAMISTSFQGTTMLYVDFETGQVTGGFRPGYSPVWSPDSRRIAYAHLVFDSGFPGTDVGHVIVSDVTVPEDNRDLNVSMTPGLHYVPNAWSPDGTRILATRTVYQQESPMSGTYLPRRTLRLLDADTPYIDTLVNGSAAMDAWFTPP